MNERYLQSKGDRKPITAEVIHIAEGTVYLDPVTEVAEVQKMVNEHNRQIHDPATNYTKSPYGRLKIKRSVLYTGYLINEKDAQRLVSELLQPALPAGIAEGNEVKPLANIIMITPRPAPKSILRKAGGTGKKISWRVTGFGHYDRKLWAARVEPVSENETYYTETPVPIVVLGLRRGARPVDANRIQKWQPVDPDKSIVFDAVVGERALLRVDEDGSVGGDWGSQSGNKSNKRRHPTGRQDEDISESTRSTQDSNPYQALSENGTAARVYHGGRSHDYRGRGRGRGSGPGRGRGAPSRGGNRGRGRGGSTNENTRGYHGYRSLDEHQTNSDHGNSYSNYSSSNGGVQLMDY